MRRAVYEPYPGETIGSAIDHLCGIAKLLGNHGFAEMEFNGRAIKAWLNSDPGQLLRQFNESFRERWRVGHSVALNVYDGNRPVCQCHDARDALLIVEAVNARRAETSVQPETAKPSGETK